MKKIKTIVLVALLAVAALSVWVDYSLWRLQHPQAPAWTYLFSE
jgi:Flp pilus assembly protein CpaB